MTITDGPRTLGRWPREQAVVGPTRVAIVDRGLPTTYAELEARASALTAGLREGGYANGDVVATITASSTNHVVTFFACAKTGLVLAPLSWRLTSWELADQLHQAKPQLILVEAELLQIALEARQLAGIEAPWALLGADGVESAVPAATTPDRSRTPRAVRDDDPLLLTFTSGTSGTAKGVVLTHENCTWTNFSLSHAVPIGPGDIVLGIMPQYHVGGWNVMPLLAWWNGATVVLERTFDAGRALRLITAHGVTALMGVPTQYLLMAQHPDFTSTCFDSLEHAVVGGAAASPALLETWHDRGVRLMHGYGLGEAGPNVACTRADEAIEARGTVGTPYPHVEVALADPATGAPVRGVGEGELLVRGGSVFPGYLDDPVATARAFRDGWLRTGDLAVRDEAGRYTIVDRIKDLFISGGEQVAPVEIEQTLAEHPGVADVAVAGVPDARWGEVPVAWVIPARGSTLEPAELREFVAGRLAPFKVPRHVVIVERMPRTASGKTKRRDLLAAWLADRAEGQGRADKAHGQVDA